MKYTINKFLNVRFLSFSVMLLSLTFSTSYCGEDSVLSNIVKSLEDTILVVNQPDDATVAGNSTATFSVVAVSQNSNQLSYQWYSIVPGSTIINTIKGATKSSYVTPKLTDRDSGTQYFVIITSSATGKVTSKRATVTVDTSVTVSTQPEDVNVGVGSTHTFSIVATGASGLTYQWQKAFSGSNVFSDIARATGTSYTTDILSASSNGDRYKVKLTVGGRTIDSSIATITVTSVTITSHPNSLDLLLSYSNRAIFTVSASSTPASDLSYQWQKCIGGGTCTDIAGATSNRYETEVSVSDNGNEYRVVVKAALTTGFISVTSNNAILTVTQFTITQQPVNARILPLFRATFNVTAISNNALKPPSYQWQSAASGSTEFSNIEGATNSSYATPPVQSSQSGTRYRALLVLSEGIYVESEVATVTIISLTQTEIDNSRIPISLSISAPRGLVFDSLGNLYFCDSDNLRIIRVSPNGDSRVIAGTGTIGLTDDTDGFTVAADGTISGITSQFRSCFAIAIDSNDFLYIADQHNSSIRKISTTTGVVTTIAGTGTGGFADDADGFTVAANGTISGVTSQFAQPRGVAIDSMNNVYVADAWNNRIRKITPTGVVTTIAGTGPTQVSNGDFADDADGFTVAANGTISGITSLFSTPFGIAIDSQDNIYVADTNNNRIRKITSTGVVSTIAGTGTNGSADDTSGIENGITSQFSTPVSLAIDSLDNIYVNNAGSFARVAVISSETYIVNTVLNGNSQNGLAFFNNILYVVDTFNNRILKIQ